MDGADRRPDAAFERLHTRECLALEADTSLGSGRVTHVLDRLIEERGQPESVRSDNGPAFTSRRMLGWAEERKITLVHIQPAARCRTAMSRASTDGCATNASTQPGLER
jgi:transposase InsO family protein